MHICVCNRKVPVPLNYTWDISNKCLGKYMISSKKIIPITGTECSFSKLSIAIRGFETPYLDYAGYGSDPNRAKTRMIWEHRVKI